MTYNDNDGLIWMGDWPWIEVCCSPPMAMAVFHLQIMSKDADSFNVGVLVML